MSLCACHNIISVGMVGAGDVFLLPQVEKVQKNVICGV